MNNGWLAGRVAIVTGASRGIGRATAASLASAGAVVVAAARSKDKLESLQAEITSAGNQATSVGCDVSDPGQVEALFDIASK